MDDHNPELAVRVAVIIRPFITPEELRLSRCITVTPDQPQEVKIGSKKIGSHSFTFDHVYTNPIGSTSSRIFDDCVAPLVDALFHGYNATVLAYGQTGSGKTYTMGSNYSGESMNGIIPKAMQTIFRHVEATKGTTEYLIRVSFIEIFKEKVFDLLESSSVVYSKGDGNGKVTGPSRVPIQIRETANGGISLAGVIEAEVTSVEEMAAFLLRGSLCRATGSTEMNSQSSRSHAIFTISMEQKRIAGVTSGGDHDDVGDDILSAKLHLVDLAGCQRAKKTGADGMRLREGIQINKGLSALDNVISLLGDDKRWRGGGHVPYRGSKLTRLLRDSLGGNSKTVMIACVSPADTKAEETLNTLKYANWARNIQNKAIVNRDLVTANMQMMENQTEQLQAELLNVKGDSSTPLEERQKQKIAVLEGRNADLQKQLQEHQVYVEYLTKQASDAHILKQKIAVLERSNRDLQKQLQEHQVNVEHLTKQATHVQDVDVLKSYTSRNQELEGDLLPSERLNTSKRSDIDYLNLDSKTAEVVDNFEDEEKELEHCSLQEKPDNELKELDKRLEQNEKLMPKSFKRKSTTRDSTVREDGEGHANDLRPKGLRNSIAFDGGSGNTEELLEDMATSESEHSDLDSKKRNSKIAIENNTESETNKTSLSEENLTTIQKAHSATCCTCSRSSSCKTSKCECRIINGLCSVSCGCHPKKCSNREAVSVDDSDLKPTVTVGNVILLDDEDIDKSSGELASQGAMLLQAALSDKPAEIDGMERKRPCDIDNRVALREATSKMTDVGERVISKVSPDALYEAKEYITDDEKNGFGSIQKAHSGTCCTCSRASSCKTSKCECRLINGLCSVSCGCHPKKCSNREPVSVEDSDLIPTVTVGNVNLLDDEDTDKNSSELASQGAMLLQAALSDKPADIENMKRKPFSDIHNKIVKSNAPKPPAARKKLRKSTIQLVPVASDQPSSSQTQEPEAPKKQETSTTEPSNIPVRLTRAMRSAMSNADSPLRDRNSEPPTDSTITKEHDNAAPRSRRQHPRQTTNE